MRIVEALDPSAGTVCRTKRRYLEGGLKPALEEDSRPGHPTKLDERGEAHLIWRPSEGHDHWTGKQGGGVGAATSMHEGISQAVEKNSPAVAEEGVVFPR